MSISFPAYATKTVGSRTLFAYPQPFSEAKVAIK